MNDNKTFKNIETFPKGIKQLTLTTLKVYQHLCWYVRFRYYHQQTSSWKLIIRKIGVNSKGLSLSERKDQLIALHDAVEFKLIYQGWNPIDNTYSIQKSTEDYDLDSLKAMPLTTALQFAYDKKKADWSPKTRQDYASMLKYIKEAAVLLMINFKPIEEIKRIHCRLILDKVKEHRNLSNKGYNKYRETLSSFFSELEEFEVVEYNPVHKLKSKEEVKVFAHRPPTEVQRQIIIDKIKREHYNYYRFICVLYGCTLRPKEITRLKVKDLIREEQIFRIIPDKEEGNSKTAVQREVVIPDWLMKMLEEMNLQYCEPEWYIFSGKQGGKMFMPGRHRMHSNSPTRWWKNIVKEELGFNVTQYSLKKLAGNDMVKLQVANGVQDLLALPKLQMGHSSTSMTEVYVDEHKKVLNEIMKKKMPVL